MLSRTRVFWTYDGLNFGEHILYEVVWQAVDQIVKLGYSPVVFFCVCVREWAQQGRMTKKNCRRAFAQVGRQTDFQVALCSYILIGE